MATRSHWTPGNIAEIKLGSGWAYAQVIKSPLVGYYTARRQKITDVTLLIGEDFKFKIWTMRYAIGKKGWPVIGHLALTEKQKEAPWFHKKDTISGEITKHHSMTGEEIESDFEECSSLECAAVWDPVHIESRLSDEFLGCPNKWVESLRLK